MAASHPPAPDARPPFVVPVDAAAVGVSTRSEASAYLAEVRDEVRQQVAAGKAYWFRGFPARTMRAFHDLIRVLDDGLLAYSGAKVQNADEAAIRLYSPTSTPPRLKNFLHNEMAYQRDVPAALTIFCERAAPQGGESLVSDQREVYRAIPEGVRETLERRRLRFVRYLRNRTPLLAFLTRHSDFFALMPSWQGNLGTEDRDEAQELCESRGFEVEWTRDGGLLLTCVMDPSRPHPVTGEPMWCNNAHLFQPSDRVYGRAFATLARAYFAATGAPMTTCYYGDGEPFEEATTTAIIDATEACEHALPLQAGDFVYANNHAIGHGRTVFQGPRKLYFGIFA